MRLLLLITLFLFKLLKFEEQECSSIFEVKECNNKNDCLHLTINFIKNLYGSPAVGCYDIDFLVTQLKLDIYPDRYSDVEDIELIKLSNIPDTFTRIQTKEQFFKVFNSLLHNSIIKRIKTIEINK